MKLLILSCIAILTWSTNAYEPIDGNYGLRVPLGFSLHSLPTSLKSIPHSKEIASLPEHFDARDYFSQCSDVISRIGDQGNCGSCWTFGVAFAISDRICIASNGQQKPWISTQDLMECMNDYRNNGCQGGWSNDAWNFYATNGIVTGSGSDIEKGCKPNIFSDKKIAYVSFSCTLNCESSEVLSAKHDDESKMKQYLKDKHFGAGLVTTISSKDSDHINKIKLEMYKNGPVTALMFVPEKTERQKFETDAELGLIYSNDAEYGKDGKLPNHAVRLIGWGKEKNTPYWLVANSWGKGWGRNGTVKIQQGTAMIDDLISFGKPDLSKKNTF